MGVVGVGTELISCAGDSVGVAGSGGKGFGVIESDVTTDGDGKTSVFVCASNTQSTITREVTNTNKANALICISSWRLPEYMPSGQHQDFTICWLEKMTSFYAMFRFPILLSHIFRDFYGIR